MNSKLTKAQNLIFIELSKGRKLERINTHYQSGGTYVWSDTKATVNYTTFWNLMRNISDKPVK